DYYKRLKEYALDLTPGEVKICTFLKLNMTSKEISAITHQSVKSIEVTRTRIRKKLNLTNKDVNLVSFLIDL
uniref:helix-turn-helix transcriptional regulator n=1 Tax=Ancylomarina sp. TaxID=1970196 RepID=UPI0035668EB5